MPALPLSAAICDVDGVDEGLDMVLALFEGADLPGDAGA